MNFLHIAEQSDLNCTFSDAKKEIKTKWQANILCNAMI